MMLDDETEEEDGGKGNKKSYAKKVKEKIYADFEKTDDKIFDVGDTINSANKSAIILNQTLD